MKTELLEAKFGIFFYFYTLKSLLNATIINYNKYISTNYLELFFFKLFNYKE